MPREIGDRSVEAITGARFRSIREALGMTQVQFRDYLQEQAGVEIGQAELSRLETGMQRPTVEDIAVWSCLDPHKRGRLWLAWGDEPTRATRAIEDERCREVLVPPARPTAKRRAR